MEYFLGMIEFGDVFYFMCFYFDACVKFLCIFYYAYCCFWYCEMKCSLYFCPLYCVIYLIFCCDRFLIFPILCCEICNCEFFIKKKTIKYLMYITVIMIIKQNNAFANLNVSVSQLILGHISLMRL